MPGQAASVLAHQGGWDEILFVLAPIALFAGLLVLANRRAATALADQEGHGTGQAGGVDGPSDRIGAEGDSEQVGDTSEARDGHGVRAAPEERRGHGPSTG